MSNNMQSKQLSLAAGEVIRIHGDEQRKQFYFQLEKTKDYSIALAPYGTADPTAFWVNVTQATGTLTRFDHYGEIFYRNDSGQVAGIALAADNELDISRNYVP